MVSRSVLVLVGYSLIRARTPQLRSGIAAIAESVHPSPRSPRHKTSSCEVQHSRSNPSNWISALIQLFDIGIMGRVRGPLASLFDPSCGSRCSRYLFDQGADRVVAEKVTCQSSLGAVSQPLAIRTWSASSICRGEN